MRRFTFLVFLFTLLLLPALALAVPVTVNYSADNVVVYYGVVDYPGSIALTEQTLGANFDNWRIADGNAFDVEAGHTIILGFVAENIGSPTASNPGGFLAEIQVGDIYGQTTSSDWFVGAGNFTTDPFMQFSHATEYGSNDDQSTIWYGVNGGMVEGISGDAQWIWTENNFGANTDQVVSLYTSVNIASASVPEPATMLLLGTGLLGIAGVSRKKLKKS